jgi:hypothetical protein
VTEQFYGPMWIKVQHVLDQCHFITADRRELLLAAPRPSGYSMAVWHAAETEGRLRTMQVAKARSHAVDAVQIALINEQSLDNRWIEAQAANAAVGYATSDLVGAGDYGMDEHLALIMPWSLAFADERQINEEAA